MRTLVRVAAVSVWAVTSMMVMGLDDRAQTQSAVEAVAGFDGLSNGFAEEFCANQATLADQSNPTLSPPIPPDECNFDTAVEEFTGPETAEVGLGPIFNEDGCGTCHSGNPILGATSAIAEKRAGFFNGSIFIDHPGGSLIQDKTLLTHIQYQERVIPSRTNVIALRNTISVLGDGFVEAIATATQANIVNAQPAAQRGLIFSVPVLERPGGTRTGRFGHKNQQASLLSFSADAYVNEMGITSPMQPDENTSNGTVVPDPFFPSPQVDNEGVDVALFALFMRSTKVPPVDPVIANSDAGRRGKQIFSAIGCAVCHTPTVVTAAPGTLINAGGLRVAKTLGNKIIHPFSDFALHDLGTGDGIVQNGGAASRNRIRTPPLWGLRARGRFIHDNVSLSVEDAIRRHGNQGAAARANFDGLSTNDKTRVLTFLNSL